MKTKPSSAVIKPREGNRRLSPLCKAPGSLLLLLLLLTGLYSCKTVSHPSFGHITGRDAAAETAAPQEDIWTSPHPFKAGELLAYRLSVTGIYAGTAYLLVEAQPESEQGDLIIHGELSSAGWIDTLYPIRFDVSSWVDGLNIESQTYRQLGRSGSRSGIIKMAFTRSQRITRVDVERGPVDETFRRRIISLQGARDPLAAIFLLRAYSAGTVEVPAVPEGKGLSEIEAIANAEVVIPVVDGVRTRLMWINTGERELVQAPAGDFRTIRYDCGSVIVERTKEKGLSPRGTPLEFTIWLSDDESRIPVRIRGPTAIGAGEAILDQSPSVEASRAAKEISLR